MSRRGDRPRQINFQVDDDLYEDLQVIAHRRGQTLSEFIRRTVEAELEREAQAVCADDEGKPW